MKHALVMITLRQPTSCDGCCSPSSVVDLGRVCDLRSFVDWFCDMAQKSEMACRFQTIKLSSFFLSWPASVSRSLGLQFICARLDLRDGSSARIHHGRVA
jgi:hypothetical protein